MSESELDPFFKYKVEQTLRHGGSEVALDLDFKRRGFDPTRYFVVERVLHECSRGWQAWYLVRQVLVDGAVSPNLLKLNESELVPCGPFQNEKKEESASSAS